MTLLSRVKVLGALAVQTILILMLSIQVVTRATSRAASQTSCSHTFVSSPNVGMSSDTLTGVSAVASTDVWAVGRYFNTTLNRSRTLIEHWNGASWSVVSSPSPGSSFNELDSVSAVADNDVWAVGEFENDPGPQQTLTELIVC